MGALLWISRGWGVSNMDFADWIDEIEAAMVLFNLVLLIFLIRLARKTFWGR